MTTLALDRGHRPTRTSTPREVKRVETRPEPGLENDSGPAIPAGRIHSVHMRQSLLVTARLRLFIMVALLGVVALISLLRIGYVGFVGAAPSQTSLAEALLPSRGEITDRHGTPLARTFPAYALWFNPRAMEDEGSPLVADPADVTARLMEIFPDLDKERTLAILKSPRGGYIQRRILPEDANRVFGLGEIALEIPRESDRHYPQGALAAHILGYVKEDENRRFEGRLGMEQVLNEQLSDKAMRAEPVALSIDLRVQGALEDELSKGMLATNAIGAAGIVLDVDTGEIMAMASLPAFNPNLSDAHKSPNIYNRATNATYELGSTFKPITVAAAIDAGVVRNMSAAWDASPVELAGRTFRDLKPKGDTLTVPEALAYSSNTVTMRIADELGEERLRQTVIDLGMKERPVIELPARGMPQWAEERPNGTWSRLTNMVVSYGHGLAVTPLHLATAYSALVNGGIWRPATLRKIEPGAAPRGRRVFKASTSSRMRQLLRMISIYGTGQSADAPGYRVGGKTGSAEKPGAGGYRQTALISSFAAAFPMDRPRYVVVTMLDEPKGTKAARGQRTAAFTAAPIVRELVPRIGPMLGVRPDTNRDVDISDLRYLIENRK
ncbi:peptidoglycan glycosyltransferase [Erythrobacter sp. KY5]|uniref:peptidoglycan D,D-transpeptidase FtsI family protein n=1 Tax=Erythrobacter sp. KY5 TaxID=2011159 RepID=UPI000DBF0672|nr:penicillin-binding protein 2 [Erythrobacter sp. KY5]AWW73996.1 peptidoglycan glycosyltransferase [Erythrobacter sp. KY5]